MTVSYALRGSNQVSAATQERIQQLTIDMGYVPDPMIQRLNAHLASRKRGLEQGTLAYINAANQGVDARENPQFSLAIDAAAAHALRQGYRVELFDLHGPNMNGRRLSRILRTRGFEGIILSPVPHHVKVELDWSDFSVVAIGRSLPAPHPHQISAHHRHILRDALNVVRRKGYRRIGLTMPEAWMSRVDASWMAELLVYQHDIPERQRVRPWVDNKQFSSLEQWLGLEKPEVVMSQGTSCLHQMRKLGRRIPEDIGYVQLDRLEDDRETAGMTQRFDALGEVAVNGLIAMINRQERGIPDYPLITLVEGKWIEGPTLR